MNSTENLAAIDNFIEWISEISDCINSDYWNGEDVMGIFFNEFPIIFVILNLLFKFKLFFCNRFIYIINVMFIVFKLYFTKIIFIT